MLLFSALDLASGGDYAFNIRQCVGDDTSNSMPCTGHVAIDSVLRRVNECYDVVFTMGGYQTPEGDQCHRGMGFGQSD